MEETKSPACRMAGESKADCVSRKIPEIMKDDPSMEQDQAVAMAESMCGKLCKEAIMDKEEKKENKEIETRELGEKVFVKGIFEGEVKALGEGEFEAVVNTGQVDREGERLNVEGVDLNGYKQNAVVLYGHDYYSLPIGKSVVTRKLNGNIITKFKLAVEEYDFAATVAKLIQGGYLNATSIGVIVKEWSNDFKEILKSEMVEFSIVPVPADRGALITRNLAAVGKTEDQFRAEYKQFMQNNIAEKTTKDELATHIVNLKSLVALLEETHKESQNEAAPKKIRVIKTVTLKKTAGQIVRESEKAVRIIKITLGAGVK